jgi:hypothetical protein
MTWVGVRHRHAAWFSRDGAGGDPLAGDTAPGATLARGTIMVEARIASEGCPQTLLAFERSYPSLGGFSLRVLPDGSVVLVEAQGADTRSAVLPCPYSDRSDFVRLTYSWDADARRGRLAIERPEPGSTHIAPVEGARPMVVNDLRELVLRPDPSGISSNVLQVAISDAVEPIGPMPTLTALTPVLTDRGERPIRDLRRGDLVRTDSGDLVPVLHVVRRVMPAHGGFRPIRLRAGYFGLTRNLVVAPDQRLVLHGSEVEYMFGREAVLVPARHLVNNVSAFYADGPEMVALYQVILPGHEAIIASGCAVESLYLGRIRRKPEHLAASLLAGIDRNRLPEHAKPVWPVLKPFEAVTLATSRVA